MNIFQNNRGGIGKVILIILGILVGLFVLMMIFVDVEDVDGDPTSDNSYDISITDIRTGTDYDEEQGGVIDETASFVLGDTVYLDAVIHDIDDPALVHVSLSQTDQPEIFSINLELMEEDVAGDMTEIYFYFETQSLDTGDYTVTMNVEDDMATILSDTYTYDVSIN